MMQPVGLLSQVPARPDAKIKRDHAPEEAAAPTSVASKLVLPADAQSWQQWQAGRARLVDDHANSNAIATYNEMVNQPLRQQLQSMIGVDLYV
ncbi:MULTISPECIES: hypothetical protein [Ferrimonas]|uniref:hypothetical protein n=1 Tax=Ferrimonas TaxID=44011 RepID=UPI00146A56C8|nr:MULTISPECIES: hypothetical protein [Ferrimonas]USD39209.1 hypothetical protein J8Z22_08955 [Ferrimonas sp. SCSIO 43195]